MARKAVAAAAAAGVETGADPLEGMGLGSNVTDFLFAHGVSSPQRPVRMEPAAHVRLSHAAVEHASASPPWLV